MTQLTRLQLVRLRFCRAEKGPSAPAIKVRHVDIVVCADAVKGSTLTTVLNGAGRRQWGTAYCWALQHPRGGNDGRRLQRRPPGGARRAACEHCWRRRGLAAGRAVAKRFRQLPGRFRGADGHGDRVGDKVSRCGMWRSVRVPQHRHSSSTGQKQTTTTLV